MASGTVPPPPQQGPPPPPPRQPDPYETLIDQRVRLTRRQVKRVDVAAGLLTLLVGGFAYLFVAALIDHWVVPGGLGFSGRLTLFLILTVSSAAYFIGRVLPLLIHRINPLFAAYTIEQSRPSLKNSLINLLFLRGERDQMERDVLSQRIYQGLERTAAADLSRVSADAAVDHSRVLHKGYLLAGLLAISALYLAISPKNPLTSFGRVVFPWAGIRAPTRVSIDRVEPGDAVVYQGDYVTLSAELQGLQDGEPVLLYYSTADGQSVNQAVPMTVSEGDYRHRCQLPPGPLGMQQETTYYLKAGDCTTQTYRLEVQPALSIRVDSLDYRYPEYTGLGDRRVERQGDVRAIEGTQITVHATASHPIQQAMIEMDCKSQFGVRMTSRETAATGQFTLAMSRDKPDRPEHDSYQLRFRDPEGREDRRPTRYRIEVIPDLPPDVKLIEPPPDGAQLPVDGVLPLRVRAEDPDFALRSVALRMAVDGKSLPIRPLLNKLQPEKPHQGPLEAVYRFQPAKLGLKAGDKIVYLAEATDNKEPVANRTKTQERTLVLVPPQDPQGGQQTRQQDKQQDPRAKPDQPQPDRPRFKEDPSEPEFQAKEQPKPQQPENQQGRQPNPQGNEQMPQQAGLQEQRNGQENQEGSQQGQQGAQQNSQGGQAGQGDSSASSDGKGESGGSAGKQGQSSSQQAGEKGQGGQSDTMSKQGGAQGNSDGQQSAEGTPDPSGSPGSGQSGQRQAGSPSGQAQQPVDQSNAGEVFEKALERRAEEKGDGGRRTGEGNSQQQIADGNQPNGDMKRQDPNGKQQAVANRQPGAEGKQQNPDGKEQVAGSKQANAEGKPQDANSKQQRPGGNEQNPGGKQPNADAKPESSGTSAKPAPRGSEQAANGKPENADSKQPNGDGKQPNSDGKQPNADGKQPNGDGRQSNSDGKQANADGKKQGEEGKQPSAEGKAASSRSPSTADPNSPQPGGEPGAKGGERQAKEGQAEKTAADKPEPGRATRPDKAAQPEKGKAESPQTSGDRETNSGAAGEGQAPKEPAPVPQENGLGKPKDAGQGSEKKSENQDSAKPSQKPPRNSDTQGDMGGDRPGEGDQGSGQSSKQAGNSTAGSHSSAEQGGGTSDQKGKGETGTQAGDQAKADHPTGQSAKTEGAGNREQPGDGKQPTGGGKTSPDSARHDAQQTPDAKQDPNKPPPDGGNSAQGGGQAGRGNPTVGGGMSGPQPDGPASSGPAPLPGDAYNREFTEKQTTLALEYLKDQLAKEKPDPKLLDQLGWDRQKLEQFVSRWEAMRRAAAEPGPSGETAKRQFEEALKSLGLRPRSTVLRGGQTSRDRAQNLKDAGRFEPPPEYSELLRAYRRGVSGSKE